MQPITKMICEVFEEASKEKTKEAKARCLQKHDSITLRRVLHACFHPDIKFALPDVPPPYKPSSDVMGFNVLHRESRLFPYFIEGGVENIKQSQREKMFIQMLESIHPKEAEMMLKVYVKKSPQKTITQEIAHMAFPDLIPAPIKKEKK